MTAGPNWGMHRGFDYRVLMAIATGMCLLAAASAVFVIVEHLVGITLVALGVGWLVVAVLRRELRIRRRLADTASTHPTRDEAGRPRGSPTHRRYLMNPTNDPQPGRVGTPTVREIAQLTARLRELTAAGRGADPAERAQFLADKHALIARITDQDHMQADAERGHQLGHDEQHPIRVGGVEMPQWMREQAAHTEAAIAAGTAPPTVPGDDRAELAARVAALREQADYHATEAPAYAWECDRPTRAAPSCLVEVDEPEEARREQLARWHTDDTESDRDTAVDGADDGRAADGPGDRFILVTGTEQP